MLDPQEGGYFAITPRDAFEVEWAYRSGSNVLETIFTTAGGKARMVESLNSGSAGRLPRCELARRIEGLKGSVHLDIALRLGQPLRLSG